MRRVSMFLVLAWLGAVLAWGFNAAYSSGGTGLSITDVNLNTAFVNNHSGGSSVAFNATWITIVPRSGSDVCFYDLDGVATTDDHRMHEAGVTIKYLERLGGVGWSNIGAICSAGQTATWDVSAGR